MLNQSKIKAVITELLSVFLQENHTRGLGDWLQTPLTQSTMDCRSEGCDTVLGTGGGELGGGSRRTGLFLLPSPLSWCLWPSHTYLWAPLA